MGSTTTSYRGRQFEASDSTLGVWLALLVDEIDRLPTVPEWLKVARDEWDLHAVQQFSFGVIAALDRIVTDEEKRSEVLELSRRALARLLEMGDPLPDLDGLRRWEGLTYGAGRPALRFVATGRYFVKLLQGTLSPAENDARFPCSD